MTITLSTKLVRIACGLGLAAALALPARARAQNGASPTPPDTPTPVAVPFGPGERLRYEVKFGVVKVGEAELRVVGIDTVGGTPTYHIRFTLQGGLPFYKVDDEQESWFGIYDLYSRKFRQDLREGDYRRNREYIFDLENRMYTRSDGETDTIPADPLDDLSFLYFVRTLPLEVGQRYEFERYFRQDRNPVILEVVRRDTVLVPAGRFPVIVLRPTIRAGGVYGEGGESEVFLSDDERRIVVHTRSKAKVGSLTLYLKEEREGIPLVELLGLGGTPR